MGVLAAGLPAASQPHRAGSSAPATCAVRYQTQRDVDGVFAVDVTVTNTGTRPVTGQTLTFDFPGRQQITNSDGWTQAGRLVRSTAGAVPLPPHAAVTLHLTGTHPDDNPLPTEFALDGADCTAQVSGATSTADTSDQNTGADRSQVAPPPGPAAVATPDDSNPAGNSKDNDKGKAKGKRK